MKALRVTFFSSCVGAALVFSANANGNDATATEALRDWPRIERLAKEAAK